MSDDTIYRQEAIDAVEKSRRENHHKNDREACFHEYEHRHFLKILHELPPAAPKPLKYTGESICEYCRTTNCKGCMYEPMTTEEGK